MYDNINILLASKHQKEKAIQPAFKNIFNATIYVADDYDTDLFGTFTGEIQRQGTPRETLIEKAVVAAEKYHANYVISSEGSFGPHPTLYFASLDTEMICFYDKKRNLTIIESEVTTETNFQHFDIESTDNYAFFLEKILFPSHAIIVRSLDTNEIIQKGVSDSYVLSALIKSGFSKHKKLRLETDMRAMHNPTRMKIIANLTDKLIHRLKNICPQCRNPGFGVLSFEGSLPCEYCGSNTDLYARKIESCLSCNYQLISPRSDGLQFSKQQYCAYCNP